MSLYLTSHIISAYRWESSVWHSGRFTEAVPNGYEAQWDSISR